MPKIIWKTKEEIEAELNAPPEKSEIEILREENEKLKAEAKALRQRDAKMQDDINFILETLGG
ncbi:hypothetical protein [Neobacillus sp. 114]|uniref:hypothetical protein n=1 Tax=Neobacillus sp. 114 TaxID=3048535 RepID=UPI0024C46A72|nr:hypothetical protein [Neobacillus sp. 114]